MWTQANGKTKEAEFRARLIKLAGRMADILFRKAEESILRQGVTPFDAVDSFLKGNDAAFISAHKQEVADAIKRIELKYGNAKEKWDPFSRPSVSKSAPTSTPKAPASDSSSKGAMDFWRERKGGQQAQSRPAAQTNPQDYTRQSPVYTPPAAPRANSTPMPSNGSSGKSRALGAAALGLPVAAILGASALHRSAARKAATSRMYVGAGAAGAAATGLAGVAGLSAYKRKDQK